MKSNIIDELMNYRFGSVKRPGSIAAVFDTVNKDSGMDYSSIFMYRNNKKDVVNIWGEDHDIGIMEKVFPKNVIPPKKVLLLEEPIDEPLDENDMSLKSKFVVVFPSPLCLPPGKFNFPNHLLILCFKGVGELLFVDMNDVRLLLINDISNDDSSEEDESSELLSPNNVAMFC